MGKKLPLHERGLPKWNRLHAKDTAEAVISIIGSGKTNEIFNISGDFEQENIKTVSKIIELAYNGEAIDGELIDLDYSRPGQDVRYSVDDSKLRELGWKPQCNFDEELPDIIRFYKENFIW